MENKEVLHIGVGRCGNNIVDGLVRGNNNLVGMIYNTAHNDVSTLESFIEEEVGVVLIPNADGSGKNRDLAKTYANKNMNLFEQQIKKYSVSTNFVFYFSMDGGTGSGCTPELIKYLHDNLDYEHDINVVMMMRSENLSKVQLENTKACNNEIIELKRKGIVKSIMIIDNDSRDTIEEVNSEVVKAISYSYGLKDFDDSGAIDTTDMSRYFNAIGYRVIYMINNKIDDFEKALEDAIEKSVFLKPDKYILTDEHVNKIENSEILSDEEKATKIEQERKFKYKCDQLLGLLQPNRYKVQNVLDVVKRIYNHKLGVNDVNIIGMSGMDTPDYKINDVISRLKMASLDLDLKKKDELFYDEIIEDVVDSPKAKERKRGGKKKKSIEEILNKDLWRK